MNAMKENNSRWARSPEQCAAVFRIRTEQAERIYRHNLDVYGGRGVILLHGQGTEPMASMKYGTYSMKWNGCEIIACANVMTFLGRGEFLPQIVREFMLNGMQFVFPSGYWGTAPRELGRYFGSRGVRYRRYSRTDEIERDAVSAECGIVSFWNNKLSSARLRGVDFFSGGLHTVAFRRTVRGYEVYNLHTYDTAPRRFEKLAEVYDDKRFIVGYLFNR